MTGKPPTSAPTSALVPPRSTPARVRLRYVEHIAEYMSPRDTQIMDTIHRLRLATGAQLERLHFTDLAQTNRGRTRRRVLHRLTSWRVLATLPRRIGGIRAGSAGLVYSLDTTGAWLIRRHAAAAGTTAPRGPRQPGATLIAHTLAVSELYVRLVEHAHTGAFRLAVFEAEPACWWPDTTGGHLKPDARTLLATDHYQDCWWIEVDQATEPLPRLLRKLLSYLDFAHRGGIGPAGVLPRVLITTPTMQRSTTIQALFTGLPPPAADLFHTIEHTQAADLLTTTLLNPQPQGDSPCNHSPATSSTPSQQW